MSDSRKELMKLLGDFSTIGIALAASVFIGVGIGYFLDHKVFKSQFMDLVFILVYRHAANTVLRKFSHYQVPGITDSAQQVKGFPDAAYDTRKGRIGDHAPEGRVLEEGEQ